MSEQSMLIFNILDLFHNFFKQKVTVWQTFINVYLSNL